MQEYKVSSLVPFELLFDTDFGIIKFLQLTTSKEDDTYEMLYPGILEMYSDKDSLLIKHILNKRSLMNPLSCIFRPEYYGIINEVYDGIMKNHLPDILRFSCKTNLLDMVFTSIGTHGDELKFIIVCNNEMEIEKISNYAELVNLPVTAILSKDKDYNKCDTIYCKNIYNDLEDMKAKNIAGKNIIIADYAFNVDEQLGIPKQDQIEDLVVGNKFHICNIYDFSKLKIDG